MATDKTFDFTRYSAAPDSKGSYTLQDGSDALANRGFAISFQHLPSGKSVYFKAFITQFNESYAPDWAAETVYGRPDPIYFFKNTTRSISLGFKIPAASEGEAYENLARVQELVQFLYPSYIDVQNANTISQAPLVRLKVMNLLQKSTTIDPIDPAAAEHEGLGADTVPETFKAYTSTSDSNQGLLGVISSVAINHNLEDDASGVFEKAENTILPKLIVIDLEFKPIHEHTVGWDESGEFAESTAFPYGAPSMLAIGESLPGTYEALDQGGGPAFDLTETGQSVVDLSRDDPDDIGETPEEIAALATEGDSEGTDSGTDNDCAQYVLLGMPKPAGCP
jgi:hypothetical protein